MAYKSVRTGVCLKTHLLYADCTLGLDCSFSRLVGLGCTRMGSPSYDELLDRIAAEAAKPIQTRTRSGMRVVLRELSRGQSMEKAIGMAGVRVSTVHGWRKRYPLFDEEVKRLVAANAIARRAATEARRQARLDAAPKLEDKPPPPSLGLEEFRLTYFGRPTPLHQRLAVEALEDESNLYVFIFGPTGMGKDTLAQDAVAWMVAPDRSGLRVAWIMESESFARRRLGRLGRYLTDPKSYDHVPGKTPGGVRPSRSLIDDYGPFRWRPGMRHPDGSKVERTEWTKNSMYFVRVQAPENDPNLWATGIGGATYGSRMGLCVISDAFTLENQKSPTQREDGYQWLDGTLDTRLDEDGRLWMIGTMLEVENNYERMVREYTEGARVVDQKVLGPSTLVKYSNGVCVVAVKAIWVDPETGEERSYWPERFPLHTVYRYKGREWREADLSTERILELTQKGAKLVRGLAWRRERSPTMFKARFQQERDQDATGDFTQETLESAKDPSRSFGQVFAHELLVVGVDPARRYGAAYAVLAVDRSQGLVTLVDFYWGEGLGVTGIKDRLILEPLTKWNPLWLCYETNKEAAVLEDSLVAQAIRDSGVSVFRHHTGRERGHPEVGPGSIAAYMRTGEFRIPARVAADRVRFDLVAAQFRAWDASTGRSKPGHAAHQADDVVMAIWVAWLKAGEMISRTQNPTAGLRLPVPAGVVAKWNRARRVAEADKAGSYRSRPVSVLDVVDAFLGDA